MHVSVIIPVRNNAAGLKLCLEALRVQTYAQEDFEVIVVDNASTDDIAGLKPLFPRVRWFFDAGSGSYSARNRGLEHAAGEMIAFTDSDCLPAPSWLENAVAALAPRSATIIGGEVELLPPEGRGLNAYELFEMLVFMLPSIKQLIAERGFAITANLIAFRAVFQRVGPFDAGLKSAGDREWVHRAVKLGETLAYGGSVIVRHPRRSAFRDIFDKYRRIVGGRMALLKRGSPSWRRIGSELFAHSLLDRRLYSAALFYGPVKAFKTRVHFAALLLFMSLVTTYEKMRVLAGAEPSRG